ncbi:hypothetical protein GQ61_06665 [Candidatus Nucleicultrix amoebiphila FS5]|jgi:hypothetical protein|uniref:Uncharacterized protein n=3 Tax=Pseudomonadota TaxID=1224 RepID=A0A1W6N580_9PROT|nr:hypothetical protein GQ61_06665 [Candidatus Nucleicultrix amoebiphila FS5]
MDFFFNLGTKKYNMFLKSLSFILLILSGTTVFAGTPFKSDDQEAIIKNGGKAPGLARIGLRMGDTEKLLGSAVLLSAQSIGLPVEYEGRVFVSAKHIFLTLYADLRKEFEAPHLKLTPDAIQDHIDTYTAQKLFLAMEGSNTSVSRRIQDLYYSNPEDTNEDNDYVFGILDEAIVDVSLPKVSNLSVEQMVAQPVFLAGYGITKMQNNVFEDGVKRAGGQVITKLRGKNSFSAAFQDYSHTLESGIALHVQSKKNPTKKKMKFLALDQLRKYLPRTSLKAFSSKEETLEKLTDSLTTLKAGQREEFRTWETTSLENPFYLFKQATSTVYSEQGDSGGPAYIIGDNGELQLVGIMASVLKPYNFNPETVTYVEGAKRLSQTEVSTYVQDLDFTDKSKASFSQKIYNNLCIIYDKVCSALNFSTRAHTHRNGGTVYVHLKKPIELFVEKFFSRLEKDSSSA